MTDGTTEEQAQALENEYGLDADEIQKLKEIEAQKLQEQLYGAPDTPDKDSQFKFFRDMVDKLDSSKIANLSQAEIGMPTTPVRGLQSIALYAEMEGYDIVGKYLRDEAETTLATSLSKKGFLAQLFVTDIKKTQKIKQPEQKKNKWFSKNIEDTGEQDV